MKRLPTASIAYVGAALVMGALNAIRSGADIGSAGGIGFALSRGPLLGLVIGGGRRLFGPTNVPRWIFWISLVSLALTFT